MLYFDKIEIQFFETSYVVDIEGLLSPCTMKGDASCDCTYFDGIEKRFIKIFAKLKYSLIKMGSTTRSQAFHFLSNMITCTGFLDPILRYSRKNFQHFLTHSAHYQLSSLGFTLRVGKSNIESLEITIKFLINTLNGNINQ